MNKSLVISIPHELGRAEARLRIDEGFGRLTAQIAAVGDVKRRWEGDVLVFSLFAIGQTISGSIAVEDREVRVDLILPGLFAMIANKVRGRLKTEGQLLLKGPGKA